VKDASRRLRKLRRRVYRDFPAALGTLAGEVDYRLPYAELAQAFAPGGRGVGSRGAALALWRAATERGFHAWCYEFGFPDVLALSVTVVGVGSGFEVHDAFFNRTYPVGLFELIDRLRHGWPVAPEAGTRDRKTCLVDPNQTEIAALSWLAARAERELPPIDGLRRFVLGWDIEGFAAISPASAAAADALEVRGHPRSLDFLMLYPIAVFDGAGSHRDPATMPLIGGRDLHAPLAELRRAAARTAQELATAKAGIAFLSQAAQQAQRAAARLHTDLDNAGRRNAAERERHALEETRLAGAAAAEASARDSRILQLRAALDDAAREVDEERAERRRLGAALDDASARLARLRDRLSAREAQAARLLAALLEVRAAAVVPDRSDRVLDEIVALAPADGGTEALLAMIATEVADAARRWPGASAAAPGPRVARPDPRGGAQAPGRLRRLFRALLGPRVSAHRLRARFSGAAKRLE
jgi:hypothetical protein